MEGFYFVVKTINFYGVNACKEFHILSKNLSRKQEWTYFVFSGSNEA